MSDPANEKYACACLHPISSSDTKDSCLLKQLKTASFLRLPWMPGAILFFFFLLAHTTMNIEPGDYIDLHEAFEQYGLIDYLVRRWNHWTSRILLEALIVPLTPPLWAIIDSLMFVLTWHALVHIIGVRSNVHMRWCLAALVLCYPLVELSSAGWIMTCGMYLWPLALCLYAFSLVARMLRNERISLWQHLATLASTLVAANQEQVAAIMGAALLVLFIWELAHGRKHPFLLALFAIVCAQVALALICPGNELRLAREIEYWMPTFASDSILHKLYTGVADTLDRYLYEGIALAFILQGGLAAILFANPTRNRRAMFIACVPLCLMAIGTWLSGVLDLPWHYLIERFFTRPDLASGGRSIGSLATELVIVICIAISVINVFGCNRQGWLMLAILAAGFCSRVMMGFSPTLYGSGDRTFIFMDFSMLLVAGFAFAEMQRRYSRMFNKAMGLLGIITIACALDSFASAALCDFIER